MDLNQYRPNDYLLSFDKARLQLDVIHGYLVQSYWSPGIPRETVERAVENSLCVAVYHQEKQVAFARLITDYATFAYLCDVFVLEESRGQGLSKWMLEALQAHPQLQNLRRWLLATRDAHSLYAQFGFTPLPSAEPFMQLHTPNAYQTAAFLDQK